MPIHKNDFGFPKGMISFDFFLTTRDLFEGNLQIFYSLVRQHFDKLKTFQ